MTNQFPTFLIYPILPQEKYLPQSTLNLQQSQGHLWGKGYRNGEGQGGRARVVGREGSEGGDNCS